MTMRAWIGLAAVATIGCVDLRAPGELACAPDRCGPLDAAAGDVPADAPADGSAAEAAPRDAPATEGPPPADGPPADGAAGPDLAPDAAADPAAYHFEQSTQGWKLLRPAGNTTTTARTATRAFAGGGALAIDLDGPANVDAVAVSVTGSDIMLPPPGTVISFRIWFGADVPLQSVQPYILDFKDGAGIWFGAFTFATALQPGTWNTIRLTAPSTYYNVLELGIEWRTTAAWKGTVYIDSIGW
jgi:hypothetical protein